jgi:hypothetical protein
MRLRRVLILPNSFLIAIPPKSAFTRSLLWRRPRDGGGLLRLGKAALPAALCMEYRTTGERYENFSDRLRLSWRRTRCLYG